MSDEARASTAHDSDTSDLDTPVGSIRRLALAWSVFGLIALYASFQLTVDRIRLLQNPDVVLFCDISPFVSCGPVMESHPGMVFGFPNPIIGLVAFTVMVTSGMAVLAGARFKPWYWIGLQLGLTFAGVFITWLQAQSMWNIGALCLWCMVVWATTIPMAVLTTSYALANGQWFSEQRGVSWGRRFGRWMHDYRWTLIALWYLAIIAAITATFYREFAFMWFGAVL
ncbi:MAG TPA: vitamin K epoxide reductase family protein [Terrimesophilobacter sp.]|nr:vitamin K epoxide reductase family protein [Terrimesophilobacter sp.]HRQ00845.1 vitamin K epoxide reductase family protein [Terrimesophilobacter sp.]